MTVESDSISSEWRSRDANRIHHDYVAETMWRRTKGSPALRHGPIRFLLVEHLNVAQMARGITRPPDAVRVGWI